MSESSDAARARFRELTDFAIPWAMGVAATLRLADHIEAGADGVTVLSERSGADPDVLRRLLRYLVSLEVLDEADGKYANTDVSRLLLDENGWRPWLDLDAAPGVWAESWTRLLEAVRTGSPGRDEAWYYEELVRTGRAASFDALMAAQVRAYAKDVAAAYEWSTVEHVVDVGGGTGEMLQAILAAHPQLQGTLFEQAQVVAHVEPGERFEVVAGDALAGPLPRGDVYVLSQVLHGWPDDGATRILSRCVDAGGDDVRVVIVEGVLPERPTAGQAGFDLFMLTLSGGRQRTLDDFRRLGQAVGLEQCSSQPLATAGVLVELRR